MKPRLIAFYCHTCGDMIDRIEYIPTGDAPRSLSDNPRLVPVKLIEALTMDYDHWWTALEHLIAEFRKKKVAIPPKTMKALKSAKTMIEVYGADTSRFEPIPTIEGHLLDVESNLLNMAKQEFGASFVDAWLKKLQNARKSPESKVRDSAQLLAPGLPRSEHWIRIQPSHDLPVKDVTELVSELGLSSKLQKDGHLLVYGPRDAIKELVKKMARKIQETRKI